MPKEVIEVKIGDHISNQDRSKLKQVTGQMKKRKGKRKKNPKPQVKKDERVDWIDIMGMNRDTYKRVGGAVRRR
ncbi:hypothetical protein V1498_06780 [Peribacillus sp. SCS-26]|uniref:hypothetical protein n=1 Tax=Paraperibacillus marinus TaxID=3115295 RepID=UPI003905C010